MASDLELALDLADRADEITVRRYLAEDLAIETKPDLTPVTEADHEAERVMRAVLADARPDDGVLGEEFGTTAEGARRRWIIDPIDGTKNYVRGIPVWATLIGLQDGEESTVGVVSAPALGRRWWAARGEGAWVSDGLGPEPRRMRVSAIHQLADAQLSFSSLEEWEGSVGVDALLELGRRCWRTRAFGDFWAYMLLAEGAVDVVCEPIVSLWDLAAPQAIVEEAGGTFTDLGGVRTAAGGDALATNGRLHEEARGVIGR